MGRRGIIGVLIAGSMIVSSTEAVAQAAPQITQPDPWAVLSAMNGGASAVAVCGAAASAAAAAQPAPGCVLPQVDLAAPVAPPPAPAPAPAAYYGGPTGIPIPVLIIWAGVLAAVIYILTRHHHHHIPNSPV